MSQLPQRTTGQWSLNNASLPAVYRFKHTETTSE